MGGESGFYLGGELVAEEDGEGFGQFAGDGLVVVDVQALNDLDGLRSYLASSGLDVLTFDEAPVQFWVQDPLGNVVEFISSAA